MEWLEQLLKKGGSVDFGDCLHLYYNMWHNEYRLVDLCSIEALYKGHNLERALELMLMCTMEDGSELS